MSVYTSISPRQVEEFLSHYSLGTLIHYTGIQAGIENTNYAITTTQGEFILTLYESFTAIEISCFLLLLNHLCQNNFPTPQPQIAKAGQTLSSLNSKPVALFNRLPGHSIVTPSILQCAEIGEYLAKLHLCSKQFNFAIQNPKNLAVCQSVYCNIKSQLAINDIALLDSELNFQTTYFAPELPRGIIHADLFKDNVLFEQGGISGTVDFYNACTDYFIFDIAVTCNDWCEQNDSINQQKLNAFLSGYHKIRPLLDEEIIHLPEFLRLAALRFWLSRLQHQLKPKAGELILLKDPLVFRRLLEYHRANTLIVDIQ